MLSPEQKQLITDVAHDVVMQTTPQELPLFRAVSTEYFKNPDNVFRNQASQDEKLGFGTGEIVSIVTPAVLVVLTEVVTFLTEEVKKTVVAQSEQAIDGLVKKLFSRFRGGEKKKPNEPQSLTLEQIARVRKLAYERFLQLKLSDAQANRLADAIAASLIIEHS